MQTECSPDLFGFAAVESREVVAGFDGGSISSDAGGLLLGATDGAIRLVDRFAACFRDCSVHAECRPGDVTSGGREGVGRKE